MRRIVLTRNIVFNKTIFYDKDTKKAVGQLREVLKSIIYALEEEIVARDAEYSIKYLEDEYAKNLNYIIVKVPDSLETQAEVDISDESSVDS
jgi:hypothetical protein